MKQHGSSLYLTELILSLVIFMICAFACAGMLLRARCISRDSCDLTCAVALAQSTAESLRNKDVQSGLFTEDGFTVFYNCTAESSVITAEIEITRDGRSIYTLTAAWPEGGSI